MEGLLLVLVRSSGWTRPRKRECGEDQSEDHQDDATQVANGDERNACADDNCHDGDLLPGLRLELSCLIRGSLTQPHGRAGAGNSRPGRAARGRSGARAWRTRRPCGGAPDRVHAGRHGASCRVRSGVRGSKSSTGVRRPSSCSRRHRRTLGSGSRGGHPQLVVSYRPRRPDPRASDPRRGHSCIARHPLAT